MPSFQLLRCMVALGGDQGNQVYRDRFRPIVFPELPILQFMHGDEAVSDIHVVGVWDTTNEEVLDRLRLTYGNEVVNEVFPGTRPRLPPADASIPRCTLPVYKPRPTLPDSPDPKLRPLDQFTVTTTEGAVEPPPLEPEDEPTADEIAAHAQDDEEDEDQDQDQETEEALGLVPVEDLPHIVRDTRGRGSSRRSMGRPAGERPDVNAGGSHSPTFEKYEGGPPRHG